MSFNMIMGILTVVMAIFAGVALSHVIGGSGGTGDGFFLGTFASMIAFEIGYITA